MQHEFFLFFKLANKREDPRSYKDTLQMSPCNDAIVSYGVLGHVLFEFRRDGPTRSEATRRAIRDVLFTIPSATLDTELTETVDA